MSEKVVAIAAGVVVGGAVTFLLTRPPSIPADMQQILDGFSVEVRVYEGTANQRIYTVPQINPKYSQVRILNYTSRAKEPTAGLEERDIFTLGIEDLGIWTDGTEHPEERDDWKEFIVSIRRVITTNEIWVSFQASFSHAIVRDAAGNIVYDTLTSTDRLKVLVFPVGAALSPRRFGQPLTEEQRRERHYALYGSRQLPPRGTGFLRRLTS
jgi:hypothetical protein